jgi:hypothetical protein
MRTSLFALSAIPLLVSALPFRKESATTPVRRAGINVPIKQWTRPGTKTGIRSRELNEAPSVGLGDLGDLIYAVNVNVGGTDVAVHMGTLSTFMIQLISCIEMNTQTLALRTSGSSPTPATREPAQVQQARHFLLGPARTPVPKSPSTLVTRKLGV